MSKKQHDDELLGAGTFIRLHRRNGWEFVTRQQATGTIAIVALTDADEVLLVEQFRPPLDRNTIELPAGLVGDEPGTNDEAECEAAQRELREETGYEAAHWTPLGQFVSSAGLTDETVSFFLATSLTRVSEGGGVDGENITLHTVSRTDLMPWLEVQRKRGLAIDAKLHSGIALAMQDGNKPAL